MRLLLDSHVALWWLEANDSLGEFCRTEIATADEVYFSAVTPWELGIKKALGKLDFPDDLLDQLRRTGFSDLPITADHAQAAPNLPMHHRDPFDRMLIAQAISEALVFCTADGSIAAYEVDRLDATR